MLLLCYTPQPLQMAGLTEDGLREPPQVQRKPIARTTYLEKNDHRLSTYRWRATWTAPAQNWSPYFTSFDDHINRRFYTSCHILQPESLTNSTQSSTTHLSSTSQPNGKTEEVPHDDEAQPKASGEPASFLSSTIGRRRRQAITHYLKTRKFTIIV